MMRSPWSRGAWMVATWCGWLMVWMLIVPQSLSGPPSSVTAEAPSGYVKAVFVPRNDTVNLAHLVVDEVTGRVYVGASNWIFQLNGNLAEEARLQTGPKLDSPLCTFTSCSDDKVTKVPTNNVNKVLVIDYDSRTLIVCGSLYQGACNKLLLDNITSGSEFINVHVAANDDMSSTFAFIGPEKYQGDQKKVLYVGSTFTNNGPYRDLVPAIASRQLQNLDLAELGFSSQPKIEIDSRWRDYFRVKYKYGFFSETHAYFVIVQRKSHLPGSEEDGYVTRLARMCINDAKYNTYTEVSLACTDPNDPSINYNILQDAVLVHAGEELSRSLGIPRHEPVLLGVFAPSVSHTTETRAASALCVYSLQDIEVVFTENIHMCFNGSIRSRNMEYVAGSPGDCPQAGMAGNIFNFCDADLKISGTSPITVPATIVYPNTSISSITATVTSPHTVVFLGTDDGRLKKILLSKANEANEYEEVQVDSGHAALPDMHMDITGEFVYMLTPSKVSKVKVENCTRYTNCSLCIGAKDPYCGWCSLERRCTVKSTCQNATKAENGRSPPRWLSLGSQQCIDFESVKPDTIAKNEMRLVHLTIHELPQLPAGAKYLCVFGNNFPIDAQVTPNGLICATPDVKMRPQITSGHDHVKVYLSVRSSETNTDFVSRAFYYFDCSVHTNCRTCTTSRWACNWCVYENKCTNNITTCQRTIISGENNPHHRSSHGSQFCPRFRPGAEILLPHEIETEVEVAVENLAVPQLGQTGYQCILEIEGAKAVVPARIKEASSVVVCGKRAYTYQSPLGELTAKLTVVWNGNHFVDSTQVSLYKCRILGSHRSHPDCSLCLTQEPHYQCTWCQSTCTYTGSCPLVPPVTSCPKPRIDVIRPLSAPLEGGTLVTIEGGNLGLHAEEINDKVFIGDVPCELVEYNVSVRIVCQVGKSKNGETEAIIRIGNKAGETIASEKFYYKDIKIIDVSPRIGPQSGGTRLYIQGVHLNIGSAVRVYLDDLPCRVDSSLTTSTQLSCLTSRSPRSNYVVSRLIVNVDGANRTLNSSFTYMEDPNITRIYPTESFLSGGRHILVEGTNLASVQRPRMIVFLQANNINESSCRVINDSVMECPSPMINRADLMQVHGRRDTTRTEMRLKIGFVMDEVQTVLNIAANFPGVKHELVYYEDPRFFPFDHNRIKLYKGDTLVIEGEHLKRATDEQDVNVTIGTQTCNVTSLAMNQLVCTPPPGQPAGTDENGRQTYNKLPLVVVRVGDNLRFSIGYLRYEVMKQYGFPPEAMAGIVAGGAFLILLSIIILIVYRRKSTQAEREYKRIQIQMDNLESNVRSECKQAFAELQTDMTDLTSDLEATGIPTLDHKTYVMKVFFPGVTDHAILQDPKMWTNSLRSNYDAAMVQFEQLVCNKHFLLVFIETLESHQSFSIRDKVNVPSLLLIILMGKMEYGTDILKTLLLRLIERSVNAKHPQLMLRRTESVVEKMLANWMALCMYNYLKDYAGSSLFLLYKAIKHQVEKGPVDCVTHDARYSLSEERLLKQQIDHSVVTLQVIQEDLDEKIQCKVLDCDCISQVKAKILDALYKNTPFSLRPTIDDVDLEWRHGRGGHLPLADKDVTSKIVGGWRQLNTLQHYGVKESAVMSLIARQNESFNSNWNYSLNSTSPIIPSNYDLEQGTKVHHLVKPIDDPLYHQNNKERLHKAIPEVFLTRLLSTKGTIQKFIDDFFLTILTADERLPPALKWLFDLLDESARKHNITDPEVVHAWKSNCLQLRFWVNFIKNPDFIFDIYKSNTVDSCLSVIAQTFMDSCSTSEHRLTKDSPSNKLLFAKDIPHYREMVTQFYSEIQQLPQVTDQEMNSAMQQLSLVQVHEFDVISALKDLYIYANKYHQQLINALEADPTCNKLHLAQKLENVAYTLDGEETSIC